MSEASASYHKARRLEMQDESRADIYDKARLSLGMTEEDWNDIPPAVKMPCVIDYLIARLMECEKVLFDYDENGISYYWKKHDA